MTANVCVVGGGIAGAGAAYALRDDADVTVFEAETVGGRTVSGHREGAVYDYRKSRRKPTTLVVG
ncbi:MAG: FAD-dependent oxidoreductase [archaeon]